MPNTAAADAYGREWRALELVCESFPGSDRIADVASLFESPGFSWGALLEQAVRHRLHPLIALYVATTDLAAALSDPVAALFRDIWAANRQRLKVYSAEAERILTEAERLSLPMVARKGLVFERSLYGDQGARAFDDLDFMVFPEDEQAVTGMMRRLGYESGKFDRRSGRIVAHDRRTVMTYRVHPDHVLPFNRYVDDPSVRHVEVDFALSLTWWGSEYEIPLREAFATRTLVGSRDAGAPLPAFAPDYRVIDTAMHLFREAFVEMPFQGRGNPVKFRTFLDLRLLLDQLERDAGLRGVSELVRSLEIERPMSWVLTHADKLFGTTWVAALDLDSFRDPELAASWRCMGGKLARWHGDMRRRLFLGGAVDVGEAG